MHPHFYNKTVDKHFEVGFFQFNSQIEYNNNEIMSKLRNLLQKYVVSYKKTNRKNKSEMMMLFIRTQIL